MTDWFTPYNQDLLDHQDLDLGSSGVVVLPDQTSSPTHLLVTAGKQGWVYLLNRDDSLECVAGIKSNWQWVDER